MRFSAIVTVLLIAVAAVGYAVFWGTESGANRSPGEVNVTVGEGSVEFVHQNGEKDELARGDRIKANRDGIVDTSNNGGGAAIASSNETGRKETRIESGTAVLRLAIKDSEDNPFQPSAVSFEQFANGSRSITIGEDGTGTLESVDLGEGVVDVRDERIFPFGRKTVRLSEAESVIELSVLRKTSVALNVVDVDGNSIQKATVDISSISGAIVVAGSDLNQRSTNESGDVKFDPVPVGEYKLIASAESYLPYEETIHAASDALSKSIVLRKQSRVVATASDAESNPIAGAVVSLRSKEGGVVSLSETTSENGVAVFPDVPTGFYSLSAKHPWYRSVGEELQDLSVRNSEHKVTLQLIKNQYSISGRVLDSETKEPVEGINVQAKNLKNPDQYQDLPEAVSDSEGHYTIEGLEAGMYIVGPGYNQGYVHVSLYENGFLFGKPKPPKVTLGDVAEVTDIDLTVYRQWAVAGHVYDKHGQPVKDVNICYAVGSNSADGRGSRASSSSSSCKTDENGEYTMQGGDWVFSERITVKVMGKHPVYKNTEAVNVSPQPGKTLSNVDFTYQNDPGTVNGVVTDRGGRPIVGAQVMFWNESEKGRTQTLEDGSYSISLLGGNFASRAMCEGYLHRDGEIPVVLEEGESCDGVNFTMEEGDDSFEGWASDEDGNPLEGVPVYLSNVIRGPSLSYTASIGQAVNTDESGRFRLLPKYVYATDGFKIQTSETEEYERAESHETKNWGEKDIHIVVRKKEEESYGSIAGCVQDENGDPVGNFTIQLIVSTYSETLSYDRTRPQAISNVLGKFEYPDLPVSAGPYLIVVTTGESVKTFSKAIEIRENETVDSIVITVPQTFSLKGRVVDQNGAPIHAARVVSLRSVEGMGWNRYRNEIPQAVTNEQGVFLLHGVPLSGGNVGVYRPVDAKTDESTLHEIMGGISGEQGIGSIMITPSMIGTFEDSSSSQSSSSSTNISFSGSSQTHQGVLQQSHDAPDLDLTVSIGEPGELRDLGDIVLGMQ